MRSRKQAHSHEKCFIGTSVSNLLRVQYAEASIVDSSTSEISSSSFCSHCRLFSCERSHRRHKRLLSGFKNPEPGHYRPRDVFPEHRPVTKPLSMVAKVFPEHTSESILTTKRREEYSQLEKPDPDFWKK